MSAVSGKANFKLMVKNDLIAALITESVGKMSTALKGKKNISGKLNHLDIHSHKKVRTG